MHGTEKQGLLHHFLDARLAEPRPAPEAHQKRTDAQSVPLIFLIYPTCLIYPVFQSIRFTQVFPYFTFRVFVVFQLDCSFFWILACSCQVRAKCSRPLESDWK